MSEGKSEIIQLRPEQPLTPTVKKVIKKVIVKTNDDREDMGKKGIVDLNEERFYRDLRDAKHK